MRWVLLIFGFAFLEAITESWWALAGFVLALAALTYVTRHEA